MYNLLNDNSFIGMFYISLSVNTLRSCFNDIINFFKCHILINSLFLDTTLQGHMILADILLSLMPLDAIIVFLTPRGHYLATQAVAPLLLVLIEVSLELRLLV